MAIPLEIVMAIEMEFVSVNESHQLSTVILSVLKSDCDWVLEMEMLMVSMLETQLDHLLDDMKVSLMDL